MRILITGGPVHAYIDSVKYLTNRFKGGTMVELAEMFGLAGVEVVYLTTKDSKQPSGHLIEVVHHDGFEDYKNKVLHYAIKVDAMVLGAAVANLVPVNPWKDKFPSHDYEEGDTLDIKFKIAERIINLVKKKNPYLHLFGFKLLSNVPHDELIAAAYDVVLSSGATAVFANDTRNLMHKYAVTKERGVHELDTLGKVSRFIYDRMQENYYSTVVCDTVPNEARMKQLTGEVLQYAEGYEFTKTPEGYVFGTIAVRDGGGFLTTTRGKKELDDWAYVSHVNHDNLKVFSNKKASLNAPLLDRIFEDNPDVKAIVHTHELPPENPDYPVLPYASPSTKQDSFRSVREDFYIENHGKFYLIR